MTRIQIIQPATPHNGERGVNVSNEKRKLTALTPATPQGGGGEDLNELTFIKESPWKGMGGEEKSE